MREKTVSYIYFVAGILNIATSIFYFSANRILFGITYLFLAITFISLGMSYRNKLK
jgi:hypothetical protein